MTLKRVNELYLDYSNAVKRLGEALKLSVKKGSITVDGTIQRYEFTFELACKMLKCVLEYNGIQAATPRMVVKEAFKAGFITGGEEWIDMLEDRNKTSHIYDEKQAMEIYKKIKKQHFRQFELLRKEVGKIVKLPKKK